MEKVETIRMDIVKLNVTDTEIAKMKDEFMGLTINGIEDKAGLKKVYDSRQIVKKTRTGLVKYADELKEQAIAWQKKVNSEKNRVVTELESIEEYLQAQEDTIAAEKARIQKEKDDAEAARIQARIDKLAAFGYSIEYTTITSIDDETFDKVLADAKAMHERELAAQAEKERLEKEKEAQLKAEREELEKLRAEQAKAQAIIKAENDRIAREQEQKEAAIKAEEIRLAREKQEQEMKIRAEEKRIADEKAKVERDRLHAEQVEKAREEAAEAARLKAIADAKREAEARAEAEKQAKIESDRQAALRPDKEKLQSFSNSLSELKLPAVTSQGAQIIVNEIQLLLNKIQAHVIKKIKTL